MKFDSQAIRQLIIFSTAHFGHYKQSIVYHKNLFKMSSQIILMLK